MAIQFKEEVLVDLKRAFESCRQRYYGADDANNKDYYIKNSWSYIKFSILIHYHADPLVSSIVILVSDLSTDASIMRTVYMGNTAKMLDDYENPEVLRKLIDSCSMELKNGWGR